MPRNYAKEMPQEWILATLCATVIAWVMTYPLQSVPVVLWWTWPLGTYIYAVLMMHLLWQVGRVIYWQRHLRSISSDKREA